MPATSTLGDILVEIADRYAEGLVLRNIDPDAVTASLVTLPDSTLQGPMTGASIPVNSSIVFTSPCDTGTATSSATTTITDTSKAWTASEWIGFVVRMGGWRAVITANTTDTLTFSALDAAPTVGKYTIEYGSSRVSNYNTSTGALTLSPTLGGTNAALVKPFTAVVWNKDIGHSDRVRDDANRALTNRIGRWEPRPLTYISDGDLQGNVASDNWFATAATLAYVSAQTFPANGAGSVFSHGALGLNRVLQATTSNATNAVDSPFLDVVIGEQQTWYFQTAIRVVSGSGNAEFQAQGNITGGVLPLNLTRGSATNTAVTTSNEFMLVEGTVQIPASENNFWFTLKSNATSTVIQMTQLIAFPLGVTRFPLPNRIESEELIGNFFTGWSRRGPGGIDDLEFSEPITTSGYEHRITNYGDHFTVDFNYPANRPIWYEEYVNGSALVSIADTTTFPLDRIVRWAYFELEDRLMREEMTQKSRNENGTLLSSAHRPLRNAALKAASGSVYEPRMKNIVGRRG